MELHYYNQKLNVQVTSLITKKRKLRILQNEEISGKPQNWVKTSLVIVLENFKKFRMHKLPHELPNDFRLRILRNEDILVQTEHNADRATQN